MALTQTKLNFPRVDNSDPKWVAVLPKLDARELDQMFHLIQDTCFGIAFVITPEMGRILLDLGW